MDSTFKKTSVNISGKEFTLQMFNGELKIFNSDNVEINIKCKDEFIFNLATELNSTKEKHILLFDNETKRT
jgi:hypothetical protein